MIPKEDQPIKTHHEKKKHNIDKLLLRESIPSRHLPAQI